MDAELETSLFRVLWPPHYRRPQADAAAALMRALLAGNQHETEVYEAACDRGERTWDQRN